jgi:hypothetical protein
MVGSRMGLWFTLTIASGPWRSSHARPYNTVSFETPPTWSARSPYLFPPGRGWPSYTPGHWVKQLSLSWVKLRLAVSQSICLGAEPTLSLWAVIISRLKVSVGKFISCLCGVPPLTRQVKVILRPTVSRPIRLGIRHPSRTRDPFSLIIFWQFPFVDVGRPLWREVGSVLFSFCRASSA